MTVIVATHIRKKAIMMSDSRDIVDGRRIPAPKIIKHKSILIGVSGDAVLYDIAKFMLEDQYKRGFDYRSFANACFLHHKEHALALENSDLSGKFLFADKTGIKSIGMDGPLYEHSLFWAIGSGADYAIGVMDSIENPEPKAIPARMRLAVHIACKYDPNCGGDPLEEVVTWR